MTGVFVDTGALAALGHRQDQHHVEARQALEALGRRKRPLLTSTYVLDELYTLLRFRWDHRTAVAYGERLARSRWLRVLDVTDGTRLAAWQIFVRYDDQAFSFTDCTSFALMHELGLRDAFAFERHFEAAGFARLPG
jgi:predicted nucleic acid-binding protein